MGCRLALQVLHSRREASPGDELVVIQRQMGHANLGSPRSTSKASTTPRSSTRCRKAGADEPDYRRTRHHLAGLRVPMAEVGSLTAQAQNALRPRSRLRRQRRYPQEGCRRACRVEPQALAYPGSQRRSDHDASRRRDRELLLEPQQCPSLSTSGETLTIELSMNLAGENGDAGHSYAARRRIDASPVRRGKVRCRRTSPRPGGVWRRGILPSWGLVLTRDEVLDIGLIRASALGDPE